MLILLSPAKSFDVGSTRKFDKHSTPLFMDEASKLIAKVGVLSEKKLQELMGVSSALASLNVERYKNWCANPNPEIAKQAVLTFSGEAYRGLKADEFNDDDFEFAQNHLRILSGLYGVLRPLDLIQPYRLEMGTKLKIGKFNNLYQFWGEKITQQINSETAGSKYVINLASNEYFKSLKIANLNAKLITPIFKDFSNGSYKTVMTYAKNARGAMTNFIIKNQITEPDQMKMFDVNGYKFHPRQSENGNWVFVRD